jgi:tetratricopeptide (TPR) repeat protein
VAGGALEDARSRLLALQSKIVSQSGLRAEYDRAGRLREEIEQRLDGQRSRAGELARYERFLEKRSEALYHDLRLANLDPSGDRQVTRTLSRAALAVFAADPMAPDDAWALVQPLPAALSTEQRASLVDDCYDLLLIQSESAPSAEGLQILDRAARLRPRPTRAFHLRRAECLARGGDAKGAAEESRLAEQTPPANALDHFLTGRALYARKDIPAAIGQFETAVQMDPDLFWAQVLLAFAKLQATPARPGEARVGLTGCAQRRPDFAWLYLLRAFAFGQEGNIPSALADYGRALKLNPGDDLRYVLLVNRGGLHVQAGEIELAVADLAAAIRLNPRPFQAYQNLAQIYQRQGRTRPPRN